MRPSQFGIDTAFSKRFSPVRFRDEAIKEEDILAVIEAATTAPSCFNEQPWRFVLGEKETFLSLLTPKNAAWASGAPLLMLLCSTQNFAYNGKPNRWHAFDSGTAMGYLILEALRRDIYVHPMGGFSAEKANERFGLMGLDAHAVLALGYTDEPHAMTPRLSVDELIIDRREE